MFPRRIHRWSRCLAVCSLLLLGAGLGAGALAADAPVARLVGFYESWRFAVSHLMLDAERQVFLGLDNDLDRERFIRGFWAARDLAPDQRHNRALVRWRRNFEAARRRYRPLAGDRARMMLMAGRPDEVHSLRGCHGVIRPLEIWIYSDWQAAHQSGQHDAEGFILLFAQQDVAVPDSFRLWSPHQGVATLVFAPAGRERGSPASLIALARRHGCFRRRSEALEAFEAAVIRAIDDTAVRQRLVAPPLDLDWLTAFSASATDEAAAMALPAADLSLSFPGRYQHRTVLRGRLALPAAAVARNREGLLYDRLVIEGDLFVKSRLSARYRLADSFRVVHHVAGAVPADGVINLDFYRRLWPGTYTLSLRAEDDDGLGLLRTERQIEVPLAAEAAAAPPGARQGFAALTRPEVGVLTTFPGVELLPPEEGPLAGRVAVEAVTTGGPIARVVFLFDEEVVEEAAEPPYIGHLQLEPEPRPHTVQAVVYDPAGRELARDSMVLNAGPGRFAVQIVEPVRGRPATRLRLAVETPADDPLARIDVFLDETRLATLRAPPFVYPLPQQRAGTYVRAVAHLASGATQEDLVLLPTASPGEEIDVRWVELYTSVLDRRGRPVQGLAAAAFRVRENGVEQQLLRFDTVESLAINVALLLDTSASMRTRIPTITASAQRFFETVLTPKDRATLLTFNDDIRQLEPFTAEVDALRYAAAGLQSRGTTRLYDSLIYTLHAFGGLEGKRALIVLSDGQDVDSEFPFKQVLELSLRAGVAVYPITLDMLDPTTLDNLQRLAVETGGRSFSIRSVEELDAVYRQIEEELRSQYLLVYQAPAASSGRGFREVEVDLLDPDLRARTLHGYYP